KPSKKKRDEAKRKLNKQQDENQENHHPKSVNSRKEVGVEDKQQGHINDPDQTRILTPAPNLEHQLKDHGKFQVNTTTLSDEYVVINYEDEVQRDDQYGHEIDDHS
ncbi:hypothetical protein EJD97_024252, partial [Solanum chilense]